MGIAAGPNISRDGLVLLYDFSNIKSFRGEPTTNLIQDPNPNGLWGISNYLTSAATLTYETENSVPHLKLTNIIYDSGYPRIQYTSLSGTISSNFAVSFEAKGTPGSQISINFYSNFSTKVTLNATLTNNWQRFEFSNVSNSGFILDYPYLRPLTTGATQFIRRLQAENKTYPTAYINGTRGTTVAAGGGIIDMTGKLNNAELINGPTASSQFGGLISFDGTDDYLDIGTTLQLSNNFTICFWHKDANTGYILDQGNIGEDPNGSLELTNRGLTLGANNLTNVSADGSFNTSVPNFVCVSYSSSTTKFYINGILDSTKTTTFSSFSPSGKLKIGRRAFSTSSAFSGKIYYTSIYDKVLTDSQIKDLYNATKSRFIERQPIVTTNLVLNLDASNRDSYKGTGTTWNDLSGFGNNGTLTNGPLLKNGNGGSFLFDGINDSVSTNLTGTITNLTVECWYRGTSTARSHLWNFGIYTGSNDTNLNFNFNDGYDLWVFWESGGLNRVRYNIDGSFTDNTIKCLVFTHTGSTNKVYLNGTELTITESGGNQAFTNVNGTGAFNLAGTIPFKGNIYNARFYNRALSAAEVLQNFNATKSRFGL